MIARVETEEATTTTVDVKSSKVEIERTVESSSKLRSRKESKLGLESLQSSYLWVILKCHSGEFKG